MADTENAQAAPDAATQEQVARVSQEKAMELQQLVAQQVSSADPQTPMTMTELLADEQGAFAQKVQELGMSAEWAQFKAAQQEIGQMREEFLGLEEQRQADANKTADVGAALDQDAAKVRKSSGIAGLAGAAIGGAGAAYAASKKSQSNPIRAVVAAAGAIFGGAIAAIFSAKRGMQKSMDSVQEQMGNLGETQPSEELMQKAAELQQQLGQAQQQSMEPLVDAMVERMAEREIAVQQAFAAPAPQQQPQQPEQQAPAAAQSAPEPQAAAPSAPQAAPQAEPQAQTASADATLESQLGAILAEHEAQEAKPATGSKAEAVLREREQQQASGPQR